MGLGAMSAQDMRNGRLTLCKSQKDAQIRHGSQQLEMGENMPKAWKPTE